MSGGKSEGAGRKPIAPSEISLVGSIRLTAAQWEKFKSLGGVAWLRAALQKAKLPK
jgi:hypothetical protein